MKKVVLSVLATDVARSMLKVNRGLLHPASGVPACDSDRDAGVNAADPGSSAGVSQAAQSADGYQLHRVTQLSLPHTGGLE